MLDKQQRLKSFIEQFFKALRVRNFDLAKAQIACASRSKWAVAAVSFIFHGFLIQSAKVGHFMDSGGGPEWPLPPT